MDKLKAMETFVRIARAQSISKAADALDVSRALASLHLKQLEDQLGVRLVNRTTRRLSLTEAGRDYYEFCERTLDGISEKDAELTELQKSARGRLSVLASSGYAEFVLAPVVAEFVNRNDGIDVSLLTAKNKSFSRELVRGGYDVAITMHPVEEMSMVMTRIGNVYWVPYASPAYLKAQGAPKSPAELLRHQCVSHRSIAPEGVWRFTQGDEEIEVSVKGSLDTNNLMILRRFVKDGCGVGLLPTYCIEDDPQLVRVLPGYSSVVRDVYAVYSSAKYLPYKLRLFLDFLRASLRRGPE